MTSSTANRSSRSKAPATRAPEHGKLDEATRMAKALSHPLRARVLARLNERVASPSELAGEFEVSIGTVSYHVRRLDELDCIELVDTAQRRGAIEHYYRATRRALVDDDAWAKLPPSARRGFAVEWFKMAFADVSEAIEAGRFATPVPNHHSFTPLVLDEQGWGELAERLESLVDGAFELQAESAARLGQGETGGREVLTRLVLVQYEGAGKEPRQRSKSR